MATSLCIRAFRPNPSSFDRLLSHSVPHRTASCTFSTTSTRHYPRKGVKRGDRNKMRGVSAMRATGLRPRQTLSVKLEDLAKPATMEKEERTPVEVDTDHGLWAFFDKDRNGLTDPDAMGSHGRAWTVPELNRKSWEDLHALWWVCVKERNRVATFRWERERIAKKKRFLFGEYEAGERDKTIRQTMKNIKRVLTERWYAREDAWKIVMNNEDPEVSWVQQENKTGELVYTPQVIDTESYMEEDAEIDGPEASGTDTPEGGKAEIAQTNEEGKVELSAEEKEDVKRLSPFLEQGDAAERPVSSEQNARQPAIELETVPNPAQPEKRI